jgi:hypothetical protein
MPLRLQDGTAIRLQKAVLEVVRSVAEMDPKPMNLTEYMAAACLRITGRRLTPVGGSRAEQQDAQFDALLMRGGRHDQQPDHDFIDVPARTVG